MQCGKNLSAWSLWSYSKFDKPWAEGSYQPHRGGGTDAAVRPPDQCLHYGAWKASRWDLKGPKFRKFSTLCADGHPLHSLCMDIFTCHDETTRAITVIHLNLNPPFKNPRSATELVLLSGCEYTTWRGKKSVLTSSNATECILNVYWQPKFNDNGEKINPGNQLRRKPGPWLGLWTCVTWLYSKGLHNHSHAGLESHSRQFTTVFGPMLALWIPWARWINLFVHYYARRPWLVYRHVWVPTEWWSHLHRFAESSLLLCTVSQYSKTWQNFGNWNLEDWSMLS